MKNVRRSYTEHKCSPFSFPQRYLKYEHTRHSKQKTKA